MDGCGLGWGWCPSKGEGGREGGREGRLEGLNCNIGVSL